MRLHTFQVKNCFGFRDSEGVDLSSRGNLIYILGRNSSGKTALLTAIEALSSEKKPEDHERFENFDPTAQTPALIAEFDFTGAHLPAGETFSLQHLVDKVGQTLEQANTHIPGASNRQEFQHLISTTQVVISEIYMPVFAALETANHVWVKRDRNGSYFISINANFDDEGQRQASLMAGLDRAFSQAGGGWRGAERVLPMSGGPYPLNWLTPQHIENLLWQWFPRIARFDQRETLAENLPDGLTLAHLNTDSPLLSAFLAVLDREDVRKALTTNNPAMRDRLVEALQTRVNQVTSQANEMAHSFGRGDLLTLRLAMNTTGLQVTVNIGEGRYSYYRHISENTKLLFAYYLLLQAKQINANILLFDEPNNGFHATAQEELLRFLKLLMSEGKQVIVSTHSEHLIDLDHLAGVRRMVTDAQGDYLGVRNKWNAATQGEGDVLALRPVMDAIGLRFGASSLSFRDELIITEGSSELYYLRSFRQIFGGEDLHLVPANGDDAIRPLVALLIGQGLKFKVVVDTTTHGKSTKTRLQEAYDIPDASIYEIAIPAGSSANGSGIEDIFSQTDFEKLLTTSWNPPGPELKTMTNSTYMNMKQVGRVPKLVLARCFSEKAGQFTPGSFDQVTRDNINRLLAFCGNASWFKM